MISFLERDTAPDVRVHTVYIDVRSRRRIANRVRFFVLDFHLQRFGGSLIVGLAAVLSRSLDFMGYGMPLGQRQ